MAAITSMTMITRVPTDEAAVRHATADLVQNETYLMAKMTTVTNITAKVVNLARADHCHSDECMGRMMTRMARKITTRNATAVAARNLEKVDLYRNDAYKWKTTMEASVAAAAKKREKEEDEAAVLVRKRAKAPPADRPPNIVTGAQAVIVMTRKIKKINPTSHQDEAEVIAVNAVTLKKKTRAAVENDEAEARAQSVVATVIAMMTIATIIRMKRTDARC